MPLSTLFIVSICLAPWMQGATPPPQESSQLDFWVGKWKCVGEMHAPDGKKTRTEGKNVIKRSFDGKVIEEQFSMDGFRGMSVSVYDPRAKLWRQTWVDNSGGYIALTGTFENGKMILTTIPRPAAPNNANRMVF